MKIIYTSHIDTDKCGNSQRERGWGPGGGGEKGKMGTERYFASGDGRMIQSADDVFTVLYT